MKDTNQSTQQHMNNTIEIKTQQIVQFYHSRECYPEGYSTLCYQTGLDIVSVNCVLAYLQLLHAEHSPVQNPFPQILDSRLVGKLLSDIYPEYFQQCVHPIQKHEAVSTHQLFLVDLQENWERFCCRDYLIFSDGILAFNRSFALSSMLETILQFSKPYAINDNQKRHISRLEQAIAQGFFEIEMGFTNLDNKVLCYPIDKKAG